MKKKTIGRVAKKTKGRAKSTSKVVKKSPSPRNSISIHANPFGKTVRKARLSKGMTAEDLAKKVGVSAQCIVLWETRAKANIREKNIAPLAKALKMPVGKLERVVATAKRASA